MDMHMNYFFSSTVLDFLFKGANVTTTWGMISLCLGLLSLSVLVEGFKVARSQLLKLAVSRRLGTSRYDTSERSPLLMSQSVIARRNEKLLFGRRVRFHVLQSFLHVVHLTVGYILMLAVMTYNAYFTIAIVCGAGIGYYCFALFDLPGKLLGTSCPSPVIPASSSAAEGNVSNSHRTYGSAGSVPSSVGTPPSSELSPFGRDSDCLDIAFENARDQCCSSGNSQRAVVPASETETLQQVGSVDDRASRSDLDMDTDELSQLLAQETIKVEVLVHAHHSP